MSTHSQVDTNTLGWVKTEIDETLKQARQSLEAYAGDTSDDSRLRYCITHLHQVVGTLLMVELDGAAMLAKETEALADSLYKGDVEPSEAVFEALTRGVLSIPDHLARLQFGQVDSPLRLVPMINELRAAHQVEPINELDLFTPDLSIRPPESVDTEKLHDQEYIALAKKVRHLFQQALLSWLRDSSDLKSLEKMQEISDQLRDASNVPSVEQMFWVSGGLLEAFKDNGLETTNERKRLVARLDQNLKKQIDGVDKSAIRTSAEDLFKSILLEIGQARSNGSRVSQIKQAFALETLMPQSMDADAEISDLPTPEALLSVANALGKEILEAQEILSAYYDEERDDVDSLDPIQPLFHKMSNTLEMIGIRPLKELTDELAEVCKAVSDGRIVDAEIASMPMARALITIEQSTKEMHGSPVVWKQQVDDAVFVLKSLYSDDAEAPAIDGIEVSDAALSDIEFRQLASVVGEEVRVNLNHIEEVLEAFASDPSDVELLREIPPDLLQIQGALQILGQERAAEFTIRTSDYVDQIADGALAPTPAVLDGLAVSVGTVGAYVEGLQFNRASLDSLIDAAEQDMEAAIKGGGEVATATSKKGRTLKELAASLKTTLTQWTNDISDLAMRDAVDIDLREINSVAGRLENEQVAQIGEKIFSLLEVIDVHPEQVDGDLLDTLTKSASRLVEYAENVVIPTEPVKNNLASSRSSHTPASTPAPFSEDIDDEIMEIFIEDAKECVDSIHKLLPAWQRKPDDMERLTDLRRNYHTLKGSGRMVGASDISELAWAVENMLNKVRDNKIPCVDDMFVLLSNVSNVLPEMVTHLEGGPQTRADFESMRLLADEFAAGNHVSVDADQLTGATTEATPPANESFSFNATPASIAPAGSVANEGILPQLDATLLQIFTSEARGHLTTLTDEVTSCRAAGGCAVSANLIRATHTLRGSARSVGLQYMSDAAASMERMLQEVESQQGALGEPHLVLLERLNSDVAQVVEAINGGDIDVRANRDSLVQLTREVEDNYETLTGSTHAGSKTPEAMAPPEIILPTVDIPPITEIPPVVPAAPPSPPPTMIPVKPTTLASEADDIDPELLEIFQEEAVDLLHTIEEALNQWRNNLGNTDAVLTLKRALHTLKGGARMAGAMNMGSISHATESLLLTVEQGSVTPSDALMDLLDETYDSLSSMLGAIQSGQAVANTDDLNARLSAAMKGQIQPVDVSPPPVTDGPVTQSSDAIPTLTPAFVPPTSSKPMPIIRAPAAMATSQADKLKADREAANRRDESERRKSERASRERRGQAQIRVRTELLNDLVNYAGEVSISRSRMEQQVFGFRENLQELHHNVVRFRDQLRELEIQSESQILYRTERTDYPEDDDFDPLEFDRFSQMQHLSRGLTESLHDLSTIQHNLDTHVGEAEAVLQQQARLNTDLQEGLMRTRMVEFSTQAARLRQIVRQTARELGKRVDLDLSGASDVEIDRNVLERMIGPFEHMIRNSIDHGLEDASVRHQAGKPATGKISVYTAQEGSEVVIRFSDDGAGLNVAAIRNKAIERGLMAEDSNLKDEEIIQFILVSGFSTADTITHLSGRGIGMDVVHNEVKQLGGTMTVDTQAGIGTTFEIHLPLTLSITQALMVDLGEQLFAIPIASVSNIIEVPVEMLDEIRIGERPMLRYADTVYPFTHLALRLGLKAKVHTSSKVSVLIVKTGSREIAMQVDALHGTREVVIKALGKQLNELSGLAGATILGDGRVVLILDIPGMMITDEVMHVAHTIPSTYGAEEAGVSPASGPRRPTVMVVDDSLTVRKITGRSMQKHGMEIMVAKDGVDAMEQLHGDQLPDLMLVDIEMPRMDGYELTSRVRGEDRLKHIPIIMITSRAGKKHRKRAFELGVNDYMSKPYQEDTLIETIRKYLPEGVEL